MCAPVCSFQIVLRRRSSKATGKVTVRLKSCLRTWRVPSLEVGAREGCMTTGTSAWRTGGRPVLRRRRGDSRCQWSRHVRLVHHASAAGAGLARGGRQRSWRWRWRRRRRRRPGALAADAVPRELARVHVCERIEIRTGQLLDPSEGQRIWPTLSISASFASNYSFITLVTLMTL